ncbi:hypothetical protein ACG745_31575 (plasmid) [Pseudomonas aeruginosa]
MTTKNNKPEVLDARWADWNHQVVTIKSGRKHACKVPCVGADGKLTHPAD